MEGKLDTMGQQLAQCPVHAEALAALEGGTVVSVAAELTMARTVST